MKRIMKFLILLKVLESGQQNQHCAQFFFFAKPFFFLKKANYSIRYVHRIVCLSSGFVHIYLCKNTCLLFEAFNLRHTYCLD